MSLRPAVSNTDHAQGYLEADLVIVEYGDYQCPYCGDAYPLLKELMSQFGSQIKFVFRNFPLSRVQPYFWNWFSEKSCEYGHPPFFWK